jgi:hypothetical protein
MKNLFLMAVIIAATVFDVTAQSRENKTITTFSSKSQKLITASGWAQNSETGKWIENKNVIDDRDCPSYRIRVCFSKLQSAILFDF